MHLPLANLFGLENWMLIAFVALLIFGRRLPEVGRSLGKGIIEFKKGLQGIEEDVNSAVTPPQQTTRVERPAITSAPVAQQPDYKFDPYTGKPIEQPAQPQMRFDPYTGKPLTQDAGSSQSTSNT
jgi:sec-independent protein translocase protein TatA